MPASYGVALAPRASSPCGSSLRCEGPPVAVVSVGQAALGLVHVRRRASCGSASVAQQSTVWLRCCCICGQWRWAEGLAGPGLGVASDAQINDISAPCAVAAAQSRHDAVWLAGSEPRGGSLCRSCCLVSGSLCPSCCLVSGPLQRLHAIANLTL